MSNMVLPLHSRFPAMISARKRLLTIWKSASPRIHLSNFTYLPIHRALLALNHSDSSSALEYLQAATPYDLAITGTWVGFFGNLYASYVRGQAFLAAHRYTEAAAEFRRILEHPGIVFTDPVRALARLQLARLGASGRQNESEECLRRFLSALERDGLQYPHL